MGGSVFVTVCVVVAGSIMVVAGCPPSFLAVQRYGRYQCNQKIWKGLQLYGGGARKYILPRLQSEGWTEWKMCLNGTLGPTARRFQVKLLTISKPLASVTAIYKGRNKKFILQEFENGRRFSKSKRTPDIFPFTNGEQFGMTAHITGRELEYTFCGENNICHSETRSLPEGNIRTVQLNFQATITELNLWCL